MLVRQRQPGVTLIELMIGIAIMAILLAAGMPSFTEWIQNTQVRTAAESLLNGLQTARNEAVRRNTNVRFDLTDTGGLVVWKVGCVTATTDCPATMQSRVGTEGGGNARVGVSTAAPVLPAPAYTAAIASGSGLPAGVTFNGLGAIPSLNIGTDITRIDITNVAYASARRLVIIVGSGGLIRMCDPLLALAANPQGCS